MRALRIDYVITNRSEGCLQRYLREISRVDMISAGEEVRLVKKIREGDQASLEKLVGANLRFVVSCAKKYQHLGLPLSDLINEGNIGLIKAARMFDETKGFKFISYAVWWIRQAMMLALNNDARTIRLPMNMVKVTAEIRKTSEKLEQHLERAPTAEEIREQLYIPHEELSMQHAFGGKMCALDEMSTIDGDAELGAMIRNENSPDTDAQLMAESEDTYICRMLDLLEARERKILLDFFGIGNPFPKGVDDIALELNLNRERVRQLKDAALKKIKKNIHKSMYSYV